MENLKQLVNGISGIRADNIYLVGCGGVGGYLAFPLVKTILSTRRMRNANIYFIDGDTIERRNIDRQIFSDDEIGENKASALASRFKCEINVIQSYFSATTSVECGSVMLVCVDNHPSRRNAIEVANKTGSSCIIGANETKDSEAYFYNGFWSETFLDPLVYYPEISTDESGDPYAPIGCSSTEAVSDNPQLPTANHLAASFMMKLFEYYFDTIRKTKCGIYNIFEYSPIKIYCNSSSIRTMSVRDMHDLFVDSEKGCERNPALSV